MTCYAGSIYARRQEGNNTIVEHMPLFFSNVEMLECYDNLQGKAHEMALKQWPQCDGWIRHNVVLMKLEGSFVGIFQISNEMTREEKKTYQRAIVNAALAMSVSIHYVESGLFKVARAFSDRSIDDIIGVHKTGSCIECGNPTSLFWCGNCWDKENNESI